MNDLESPHGATTREVETSDITAESLAQLDAAFAEVDPLYDFDLHGLQQLTGVLDELRDRRRQQGLSQREVAEVMGTQQSAVSDIERGIADPRMSTLRRYAAALGRCINISSSRTPTEDGHILLGEFVTDKVTARFVLGHRDDLSDLATSYRGGSNPQPFATMGRRAG